MLQPQTTQSRGKVKKLALEQTVRNTMWMGKKGGENVTVSG